MDSFSQIVLGSTVAALVVPAGHRRKALLAGALLGTLPDLDVLPLLLFPDDPVTQMITHRSASHSLLVLPVVATLLWLLLRRLWQPVREAPRPWFWAILLVLVTHPLLDAFTAYGTQLFWPLRPPPTMWASIWIIDLAYTLPLLAGVIAAIVMGRVPAARRWLWAGALLSSAYLSWSLAAKTIVDRDAYVALAPLGLQDAPRFTTPMPLNTLLWRVVVLTPQGYLVGERSLVADKGPMQFTKHTSNTQAMAAARRTVPALRQLIWFNHGFMRAHIDENDRLVVADLRMGLEPNYAFQFAVAQRVNSQWQAIRPQRVRAPMHLLDQWPAIWQRIFVEPPSCVSCPHNGGLALPFS